VAAHVTVRVGILFPARRRRRTPEGIVNGQFQRDRLPVHVVFTDTVISVGRERAAVAAAANAARGHTEKPPVVQIGEDGAEIRRRDLTTVIRTREHHEGNQGQDP
jgi:hypothetical protein